MRKEHVSIEYAKSILRVISDRGEDVEGIIRAIDCPFNPLEADSEVEREMPALQYCKLLQQYLLISKGRFLGLPIMEDDATGGFRVMCYSIIHSENLEAAINRAAEFYQLCASSAWKFHLDVSDEQACIRFTSERSEDSPRINAGELSAWYRFWAWLTGRYIHLTEVNLTDRAPHDPSKYHRLFETKVNFDQGGISLSFDKKYLENAIVHNEESVEDFLSTAPYELIIMPKETSDSLTAKIRYIIGCDFTKRFPTYENVSEILHMSTTTLRRKLMEEGTTYQEIKDNARRDASIAYLSRPELSINNTAYLMGFIDPSAFSRTFKRWTNMPPGLYRREYLGIGDDVDSGAMSGNQEAANAAVIKLQLNNNISWPRPATR